MRCRWLRVVETGLVCSHRVWCISYRHCMILIIYRGSVVVGGLLGCDVVEEF